MVKISQCKSNGRISGCKIKSSSAHSIMPSHKAKGSSECPPMFNNRRGCRKVRRSFTPSPQAIGSNEAPPIFVKPKK